MARKNGRPNKSQASWPNRIRATRLRKGLTLEELALAVSIDPSRLSHYERERDIGIQLLEAIALVLEVPPQLLLNSVDPITDAQEDMLLNIFRQVTDPAGRERVIRLVMALVNDGAALSIVADPAGDRLAASKKRR